MNVELWQIILLAFFVLVPFALMLDFWPHRERVEVNGRPLSRPWRRQVDRAGEMDASAHHEEH